MNLNSNNNSLTKTSVNVPLNNKSLKKLTNKSAIRFAATMALTLSVAAATTTASASEIQSQTSHRINAKINIGWLTDDMQTPEHDFVSNTSRVNLIGQFGLTDDLAIVYQYGTYMNLTDQPNQSFFGDHNQYVGVKGSFGELLYGRNDTMLKQSLGGADKFNDYVVDIKKLWKGENRIDDSIWYKTKSINNIQFGVTYSPDKDNSQDGWSYLLGYGDKSLKKTDLYLALGVDRNLKGYDVERVTAKFNFQGFNIGAGVQRQQHRATGVDDSGLLVNFAYPFTIGDAKMGIDFQYQNLASDDALSLGINYFYQGKNKIYLWFSEVNKHQMNMMGTTNGQDNTLFSIGFEHKFNHIL